MQSLSDFLLQRIAEDEAYLRSDCGEFARDCQECAFLSDHERRPYSVDRLLAECAAKRRIVEREVNAANPVTYRRLFTLKDLAVVYSDHPDYRDEWKP